VETALGRRLSLRQTRIRVSQPPLLAAACHCTGCQRMSASAFSLTLAIPSEGFDVTAGKPVIGGAHGPTRHFFCPHCMSWMFTRPEGMDEFVTCGPPCSTIIIGLFPSSRFGRGERLAWASTPAVHSFATQPEFEDYAKLLEAFARQGARPP
jgi:hypothetical protein